MVHAVHAFNPSTWEAKTGGCEFEVRLIYRLSSRQKQLRDNSEEHLLPCCSSRIKVWFPVPLSGNSYQPITPAPENPNFSFSLYGHSHVCAYAQTHTHTHTQTKLKLAWQSTPITAEIGRLGTVRVSLIRQS